MLRCCDSSAMIFCILCIWGILFSATESGVRSENVSQILDLFKIEHKEKSCPFPPENVVSSGDIFCRNSSMNDSICYFAILASQEVCQHGVPRKGINIPSNFTEMWRPFVRRTLCETFKSMNASGFSNANLTQFLLNLRDDGVCIQQCFYGYQPKNDCIILMWASLIMDQIESQLVAATDGEPSQSAITQSVENIQTVTESVVSHSVNGNVTAVVTIKTESTLEKNSPVSSPNNAAEEGSSSPKHILDNSKMEKGVSTTIATKSSQSDSTSWGVFKKPDTSSIDRTSGEVTDSATESVATHVLPTYNGGFPTNEIYKDPTSDEDYYDPGYFDKKPEEKLTVKPSGQPYHNEGAEVFSNFQRVDQDNGSSHFMSYFIFTCFVCVVAYILYHNKKKVLAFLVEGRRSNGGRRRPSSSNYSKLDSKLDDVLCSDQTTGPKTTVFY